MNKERIKHQLDDDESRAPVSHPEISKAAQAVERFSILGAIPRHLAGNDIVRMAHGETFLKPGHSRANPEGFPHTSAGNLPCCQTRGSARHQAQVEVT